MNLVLYIHGKGGSPIEAEHYKKIFIDCDVIGLDYKNFTPNENAEEIFNEVKNFKNRYEKIILIANSIGAYFAMNAKIDDKIFQAYFISPIVDMVNCRAYEKMQRHGRRIAAQKNNSHRFWRKFILGISFIRQGKSHKLESSDENFVWRKRFYYVV